MKIKVTSLIAALFSIVLLGCGKKENISGKANVCEAEKTADSIRDVGQLKNWVEHYDSLNDAKSQLLIRQKYGKVLRDMSDFEAAIRQHDTCIAIAKELNDTLQLIIALNNQGTNFRRLSDLEQASNNHYAALELCDKTTGDTSHVARKNRVRTYNGLGNILLSLGNDSMAESLFRRALAGEAQLNSATGQAINLANIGAIKERKGDTDSARIYYNMSMEKNLMTGNPIGISLCYQYLGNLEHHAGNQEKALEYYRKGFLLGKKTSDVWHWLKPCEAMADIFLEKNKHDSAQKYIGIAMEAATRIKAGSHLAKVYSQQSMLLELKGEYAKAMASMKKAQAYKDSAAIEQNQMHVHNLRVNYEANKRLEEVKKAETEAKYEKVLRKIVMWTSITIVVLVLLSVVSLVRAIKEKKRRNRMLRKIDEERQEFYRGITHQLKTPLTVVIGMTDQLKRHLPESREAQSLYEALQRKGNELLTLVTEMIDFNKGLRKQVNISELTADNAPSNKEDTDTYDGDEMITDDEMEENATDSMPPYILVAEDDYDVALLITSMLKEEGYRYAWAKDGEEALGIIGRKIPMLLITDIMMPRMDGLQLIETIRKDKDIYHIPIIVVSARTEDEDRLTGIKAGAEVYIGKPFIPQELLLRVKKILEQRELLKEKYSKEIADADKMDAKESVLNLSENDRKFIERVDSLIYDNIINSDLNANILADKMCISLTTLNRRIKALTGTNTTNYIRMKRLGRAKQLLLNTDMAMGEIQAVCGFESPSYFSRAFKAEFGISPSEFRKNILP